MRKNWKKRALCAVLFILCTGLLGCGGSYQELSKGVDAPDFTAELNNHESFSLSEQQGRVVLLNFWATWCSPCVEEMPALQQIYDEYGKQVEVIAVNCAEDKKVVDRFIEEKGYTFPVAYDETNEIAEKYPSAGIPYTLVIGKDGRVTEVFTGAQSSDVQYKAFRRAIKEAVENS